MAVEEEVGGGTDEVEGWPCWATISWLEQLLEEVEAARRRGAVEGRVWLTSRGVWCG